MMPAKRWRSASATPGSVDRISRKSAIHDRHPALLVGDHRRRARLLADHVVGPEGREADLAAVLEPVNHARLAADEEDGIVRQGGRLEDDGVARNELHRQRASNSSTRSRGTSAKHSSFVRLRSLSGKVIRASGARDVEAGGAVTRDTSGRPGSIADPG